jgi:hypothetical protein
VVIGSYFAARRVRCTAEPENASIPAKLDGAANDRVIERFETVV